MRLPDAREFHFDSKKITAENQSVTKPHLTGLPKDWGPNVDLRCDACRAACVSPPKILPTKSHTESRIPSTADAPHMVGRRHPNTVIQSRRSGLRGQFSILSRTSCKAKPGIATSPIDSAHRNSGYWYMTLYCMVCSKHHNMAIH